MLSFPLGACGPAATARGRGCALHSGWGPGLASPWRVRTGLCVGGGGGIPFSSPNRPPSGADLHGNTTLRTDNPPEAAARAPERPRGPASCSMATQHPIPVLLWDPWGPSVVFSHHRPAVSGGPGSASRAFALSVTRLQSGNHTLTNAHSTEPRAPGPSAARQPRGARGPSHLLPSARTWAVPMLSESSVPGGLLLPG